MMNAADLSTSTFKFSTKQSIILQYVNTGKYHFILQILILGLFKEVLLILILMFSIQNLIRVLFLRPQGIVLLRKPYYSGTELVLKVR